jgi:hypothetical protein
VEGTEAQPEPGWVRNRGKFALILLAVIGGFFSPWVYFGTVDRFMPPISPSIGDVVIGLIVIFGLFLAALIAHEGGHLLGARLAGFRTMAVGIWPLVLIRPEGSRWSVRVNRSFGFGLGQVLSVPTEAHGLRRRLIYTIGGGPAASMVTGILALAVLFGLTPERAADSSEALTLALVAGAAGSISLLFAFVNLLPVDSMADGARLLVLLRGGKEAEAQEALALLVGLSVRGIRPRQWDQSLVSTALGVPRNTPFGLMALHFACEAAQDRGDLAEAGHWLDEALAAAESSPGGVHADLYFSAAWFAAVHRNDPALARERFTSAVAGGSGGEFERVIAEAAVLAAEGRGEAAESCLHAAADRLRSGRDPFGCTEVAWEQITHLVDILGLPAPEADGPR